MLYDPFLGCVVEIDEDIPAEDDVERMFKKGIVAVHQVKGAEHHLFADVVAYAVSPVGRFLEMTQQHGTGNAGEEILGIAPPERFFQRLAGDVRRENPEIAVAESIQERYRDAVGLLPARTSRRPYPQRTFPEPFELGQEMLLQKNPLFVFAEKRGDVGRDGVDKFEQQFCVPFLQAAVKLRVVFAPALSDKTVETRFEHRLFGLFDVNADSFMDESAKEVELLFFERIRRDHRSAP